MTGTPLFHLAERVHWEAARQAGRYEMSTRGRTLAEEGFVHCSLRHQVRGTADALYAEVEDVVLLVIDGDRLDVPVRYERPELSAEPYPHVYGPIPVAAVDEAVPLVRGAGGRLLLPTDPPRISAILGAVRAEERYAALVDELVGSPGVSPPTEGSGFGASALKADGRIFAMLVGDALVVKLPKSRVDALIAAGEGGPFDAGKGRPMKEWVTLSPGSDWLALATEALGFVSAGRR